MSIGLQALAKSGLGAVLVGRFLPFSSLLLFFSHSQTGFLKAKWPRIVLPRQTRFDAFRLFRQRSLSLKTADLAIENCVDELFSFRCPMVWSKLTRNTEVGNVRFCSVCERNVYLAHSEESFQQNVSEGKCTALAYKWMQR